MRASPAVSFVITGWQPNLQSNWLSITEVPIPQPKVNQVLIKVEYAAQVRVFIDDYLQNVYS